MRALTLWQPWAYAVAHLGKRIENRGWAPPSWLIGQDLAIHAAARKPDNTERGTIVHLRVGGYTVPDNLPRGAVVCVGRVVGVARSDADLLPGEAFWFFGPLGWRLADVRALPDPVPCKGYQRLWTLSPDVEALVRAQLAGAVRR